MGVCNAKPTQKHIASEKYEAERIKIMQEVDK